MKPHARALVFAIISLVVGSFADGAEAVKKPPGTMPKVLSQAAPLFPYNMKAAGLTGEVTLGFVVDTEGRVREPHVVHSNNPWFERPAIEALLQWRFAPAELDGRPVNTRMIQPLRFSLSGGGRNPWRIEKGGNHDKLPPEFQWDQPPEPVSSAFPVYPFEELRDRKNHAFNVGMVIDRKGRVIDVKLESDLPAAFAGAARAMAAMWAFRPAHKKDGQACHALVVTRQEFRADGRGTVPVSESAKEILRVIARPKPGIIGLADLDAAPKEYSFRDLLYPPDLKEQGLEGEATIEFFIDREGDVQLPRIVSATHEEFGHFAALAAACWRYEAPRKNGRPVIVRAQRVVTFKLKT